MKDKGRERERETQRRTERKRDRDRQIYTEREKLMNMEARHAITPCPGARKRVQF